MLSIKFVYKELYSTLWISVHIIDSNNKHKIPSLQNRVKINRFTSKHINILIAWNMAKIA